MTPLAWAKINSAALAANLERLREVAPGCRTLAVIKADAYGHGAVTAATALNRADAFGVARAEEAETLREAGVSTPIVLLEGIAHAQDLDWAASRELELVVHSFPQLEMLEAWKGRQSFRVWLKLDTGMGRLGFYAREAQEALQRVQGCAAIAAPLRLMTHLACAEERDNAKTTQQIAAFDDLTQGVAAERSIANSAGILAWPASHAQWIRPGIALYGVSPFEDSLGSDFGLEPVMAFSSRIISIKTLAAGETVGYGATWQAGDETRAGIVAVGYGDGYPRHVEQGTPVLVNGREVPLIGRVSMDMIAVDLGTAADASVGDPVVLWGDGLSVERVAARSATIPYELLCGVSQRVPRIVV